MTSVTLLAYADVDDLDFVAALSVLSKAGAVIGPDFFGISSSTPRVRASSGIVFDLTQHWTEIDAAEPGAAVVIPGGPGAANAARDPSVMRYVGRAHTLGSRIYAICTGSIILARLGLLSGRHVAMHHLKTEMLDGASCESVRQGLIRDEWLTTVGGDYASSCKAIDASLQLLRDLVPEIIPQITVRMELRDGRCLQMPRSS